MGNGCSKKISWLHWIVSLTSVFHNNLKNLTPFPPFILLWAKSDYSSYNIPIVSWTTPSVHHTEVGALEISITKALSLSLWFLKSLDNYNILGHSCQDHLFSWLIWFFLFLKKIFTILFHQSLCISLGLIFPWLHPWPGSSLVSLCSVPASHSMCPLSHVRGSALTPSFKPSCIFRIVS